MAALTHGRPGQLTWPTVGPPPPAAAAQPWRRAGAAASASSLGSNGDAPSILQPSTTKAAPNERAEWAATVRCAQSPPPRLASRGSSPLHCADALTQQRACADSLQCRVLTGRQKHRVWEPQLDPPALLWDVTVVLVSPKRPSSVGAVARACGSFECEDLRLVRPRCDRLMRSARNGAKGSQYLLWRATEHDDLAHALAGVDHSVAFTRWVAGMPAAYGSVGALLASPALAPGFAAGAASGRKLALVFGREERGLDPEEEAACDAACSIPIGRLQESLSLSHAVSLALAPLFEARLRQRGGAPLVASAADLAAGPPPGDSE